MFVAFFIHWSIELHLSWQYVRLPPAPAKGRRIIGSNFKYAYRKQSKQLKQQPPTHRIMHLAAAQRRVNEISKRTRPYNFRPLSNAKGGGRVPNAKCLWAAFLDIFPYLFFVFGTEAKKSKWSQENVSSCPGDGPMKWACVGRRKGAWGGRGAAVIGYLCDIN